MLPHSSSADRFLKWEPEFDLGIPEIDDQHRALHGFVNVLADAIAGPGIDAPRQAMERLLAGSSDHFEFEEAMMRRSHYPGLEPHCEQHAELLAAMHRLQAELVGGRHAIDRPRTLQFLRDWFAIHIARTDSGFADFLRAREAAATGP